MSRDHRESGAGPSLDNIMNAVTYEIRDSVKVKEWFPRNKLRSTLSRKENK